MKSKSIIFPFIVVLLAISVCPSPALGDIHPFSEGEKMVYEIKWIGIPVGKGALEVFTTDGSQDKDAYLFELRVQSNRSVDLLYRVRDQFSSLSALDLTKSYRFRKIQKEGNKKRDVKVRFDWERNEVTYSNFDKTKPPVSLIPGTLDPLAAVYFVRTRDLEGSRIVRVPVTNGKKCMVGVANILGKQTIKIDSGVYETYLLEADTGQVGGVFEKTDDKKFKVWITADERRIPVKVETDVSVGTFTAELLSYSKGSSAETGLKRK